MTARLHTIAPLTLLKLVALTLFAAKLVLFFSAGVFQDEAYYWLWGQHPALSYFDHPPLNAWLQGLAGAIFGWNRFALRIMVFLALCADIALIRLISKRLAPDVPAHFWLTLVLFLGTPIFFVVTAVALPDHLLLTGLLAALYFFIGFLQRWEREPGASYRDLFLGAACLGVAALAKYNAAFLAAGLGLAILLMPKYRPLLAKPQLYLAALLALAIQAPVLVWNLSENLASFGFILGSRHVGAHRLFDNTGAWVLGVILFIGPVLLVPMFAFAFSVRREGVVARLTFWLSTLAIFGLSVVTSTLFHWNLVAYVMMLPYVAFYFRRLMLWAHLAYCVLFIGFILVNYSIMPLTDVRGWSDEATGWAYGWPETADAVRAAEAQYPGAFIATSDYTTSALLGYALGDADVTSLNTQRADQFDYWFDAKAHAGQDAILYGDSWRPLAPDVIAQFESVTPIGETVIERGGQRLDVRTLFLGKGFRPAVETN